MSDFIELEKALLQKGFVSKHTIEMEMQGELNVGNSNEENDIELSVDDKFKKYKKLAELYGENVFQYNEEEGYIKVREEFQSKQEYQLCLYRMGRESKEMNKIFEEITLEAIKIYLGKGAKGNLIDNGKVNIKKFCENELREKPNADIELNFKLGRCDIIIWKDIDKRSGKVVLLVECKTGKHWREKPPVNIDFWKQNIRFCAEPIKAYAITDLLEQEDILLYSSEKGIIFDRARIVSLLADAENDKIKKLRKRIEKQFLDICNK